MWAYFFSQPEYPSHSSVTIIEPSETSFSMIGLIVFAFVSGITCLCNLPPISELYYPLSPYEFSVLSVEILGNAYEQFLGKQI
jgi:hypothetical protein